MNFLIPKIKKKVPETPIKKLLKEPLSAVLGGEPNAIFIKIPENVNPGDFFFGKNIHYPYQNLPSLCPPWGKPGMVIKTVNNKSRLYDIALLNEYLNKCTHYFEFGMGGSTTQAGKNINIKKIYSVESDLHWYNKIKSYFPLNRLNNDVFMYYVDLKSIPNTFGEPGSNSDPSTWKNYSDIILSIGKENQQKLDLIFIDGRFRVACALKSFTVINDNCYVIIDDFSRKEYHILLRFFYLVDNSRNRCMAILRKRNVPNPSIELIKKYEKISC